MNDPNGKDSTGVLGVVWCVLILVAFVMATFPPWFSVMGTGLDQSWVVALNEITHRYMTFGKDIVFTYGPLGFVLVPLEHGSNLVHAVVFRLGLHVLWWISVGVLLFRVRGVAVPLLFAGALSYSGIYYDPIGWDVNMQLAGPMILTTIGYLALAHLNRRTIWAVPAMVVAAGALLSEIQHRCGLYRIDRGVGRHPTDPRPEPAYAWSPGPSGPHLYWGAGGSSGFTAARSAPSGIFCATRKRSPPDTRRKCRTRGQWRRSRSSR